MYRKELSVEILQEIIKVMFDCIEDCVSTMTIPSGKRMIHVFYVTLGFLVLSIIFRLLGIMSFISWQEALTASIIVGIISSVNYISKMQIESVLNRLKSKAKKRKEAR